jgi:diguanylate cyclase (GGDEF)-like protein/PAS domain S-box-containing protein
MTIETDCARLREALRQCEERFTAVFNGSLDVLVITDAETGTILNANPTVSRILGYQHAEIIGRQFFVLFPGRGEETGEFNPSDPPIYDGVIGPQKFIHADGSVRFMDMTVALIPWGDRQGFLIALRDVTERQEMEERMRHYALHDALTGLANRFLFMDRLDQALVLSNRYGKQFAVMFLDLDRFKTVNDTLGHRAGDLLLVQVAERIRGCVRASDTVARMGGDEFAVILLELGSSRDAGTAAQKLTDVLGRPFLLLGHECTVLSSIGMAIYPPDGGDADTLLRNADAAMYRVKNRRAGGFAFFSQASGR